MIARIREIADAYGLKDTIDRVEHCVRGRMHQTWFAGRTASAPEFDYVFQKVNTVVFKDLDALMQNVSKVSRHLRGKLQFSDDKDAGRRYLNLHHILDDGPYFVEEDGSCWRVFDYVKGAECLSRAVGCDQAYQVAAGYGQFVSYLSDLPAEELVETIPGFHDTQKRLSLFKKVVQADLRGRLCFAKEDVDFVMENEWLAEALPDACSRGLLSIRVVHNDTKMNNVLLDSVTGKAVCVIDLDTVMGGIAVNDFGDMARSIACSKAEDDHDWRGTEIDMEKYTALYEGYLEGAGGVFSESERRTFALSALVLTYELGMRFLTDYLSGDIYFHVSGEQDNLYRAKIQFELLRSMLRRRHEMEALAGR